MIRSCPSSQRDCRRFLPCLFQPESIPVSTGCLLFSDDGDGDFCRCRHVHRGVPPMISLSKASQVWKAWDAVRMPMTGLAVAAACTAPRASSFNFQRLLETTRTSHFFRLTKSSFSLTPEAIVQVWPSFSSFAHLGRRRPICIHRSRSACECAGLPPAVTNSENMTMSNGIDVWMSLIAWRLSLCGREKSHW